MIGKILMAGAVAIAAPILSSAQAAPRLAQVDPATTAAEVKAIVRDHIAAFNARDAEGATRMQTADYVGFFHGMPDTVRHAADLALTKQMVADPALKLVTRTSMSMHHWRATWRRGAALIASPTPTPRRRSRA